MEADLRDAFYSQVGTYAAAENLSVSYPNKDFDPPKGNDIYLRAQTLPTQPTVYTVCSGVSEHIWLLQISVYVRENTGELKGLAQADKIRVAFPVKHKFTTANHEFVVIAPPSPAPPIPINGWLAIPIQFRVSTIH